MDNNIIIIGLILIIFIVLTFVIQIYLDNDLQLDNFFYNVDDISTDLNKIETNKISIYNECIEVYKNIAWTDWPEKQLYAEKNGWKIFPFYAFGIWAKDNCKSCPTIFKFLKKIKGLKLATLSKLSPHTKLLPHYGWAKHSNHVIRCHYGLLVPKGCYISVSNNAVPPLYKNSDKLKSYPKNIYNYDKSGYINEEIRFHTQFKWLIFDDSKVHYAENMSDSDRIVLIIDVERPSTIKTGKSKIGDTKELMEIVNYYKKLQ